MATAAPQAAMEMPQQGANPFADPNTMAVYDQLRQTTSPKQFGDEMLAGAAQVDPQAVSEFLQELQGLDMPPEVLDALNNMVDEILANPERYPELRAQYMDLGLPEEILPEQFDPQFFAALNMAIDQMVAAPSGVQSFAQGGIAELKPIAKAIASYGRDGDTMLAHITPAEARMLRRRGGSGTINPDTGLPEFKNIFEKIGDAVGDGLRSVGKAVKKFASSTVGRLITTVALGFFLGPAAASLLSVSSIAGVAAISGFVGSAGATLLGGGNIGQALKAGAVGGLTAGAGAGIMGGSGAFASGSASTAGMTAGQAIQSRVNDFTNFLTPSAPAPVTPTGTGLDVTGKAPVPSQMTVNPENYDYGPLDVGVKPTPAPNAVTVNPENYDYGRLDVAPKPPPTMVDNLKDFYGKNIDPAGIQAQGVPGAEKAGIAARDALLTRTPTATAAMQEAAYQKAYNAAMPGMIRTYAPMAAVGLGTVAAFGGFDTKPVEPGDTTRSLKTPVTQRIAEGGTQRQMYMQGLPGVVYDDYGAPVYGASRRLPTYDVPDYRGGGYGLPQAQGAISMPSIYIPPPGTIGSRSVDQPYNNSDMYPNLVPRQYAEGGYAEGGAATGTTISDLYRTVLRRDPSPGEIDWWKTQFTGTIGERERAVFRSAAAPELAGRATEQKTARDAAAQQKAVRRSQGSGQMYGNINAGLAALAPEVDPMKPTDTGFGARNRAAGLAGLQTTYGPMLKDQRDAMAKQAAILANAPPAAAGTAGTTAAGTAGQFVPLPYPTNYKDPQASANAPPAAAGTAGTAAVNPYSNITGPAAQAGYTGPNLYSQVLAMGMPSRDAELPAYNYTPLPVGTTTRPPSTYSTGNTPASEAARRQGQNQRLLDQGATSSQIRSATETMFGPQAKPAALNMGGIAALTRGGYPRRTGQINGPGTEKSDSIPAMLSDGEFVMTAKAVRGAGKGSRRAGAKKMYALMHQLEKNSERG